MTQTRTLVLCPNLRVVGHDFRAHVVRQAAQLHPALDALHFLPEQGSLLRLDASSLRTVVQP